MMPDNWRSLLDQASAAVMEAADLLSGRTEMSVSDLQAAEWESDRDVKLVADKAAEARLLAALGDGKDLPILSEEAGWQGEPPQGDGLYWCVDPLDGSFNFHRGLPGAAISIGLCSGGTGLLGAVWELGADRLYTGAVGEGAWCDGAAIAVSNTQVSGSGVLATGFPHMADISDEALRPFAETVRRWKKIRMLGTATMAAVRVADGALDAYGESGARWWDVAGAFAIVAGAGGMVQADPVGGGTFDPISPLKVRAVATRALMSAFE